MHNQLTLFIVGDAPDQAFRCFLQLLKKSGKSCPLPYPEKFKAAVKLVKDREAEGVKLT